MGVRVNAHPGERDAKTQRAADTRRRSLDRVAVEELEDFTGRIIATSAPRGLATDWTKIETGDAGGATARFPSESGHRSRSGSTSLSTERFSREPSSSLDGAPFGVDNGLPAIVPSLCGALGCLGPT